MQKPLGQYIAALLVRPRRSADVRHTVDVEIQSRLPEYGLGRHYPEAAIGHGCITTLVLQAVENGGITTAGRQARGLKFRQTDLYWNILA